MTISNRLTALERRSAHLPPPPPAVEVLPDEVLLTLPHGQLLDRLMAVLRAPAQRASYAEDAHLASLSSEELARLHAEALRR
jgi:hypothetical protein